MPGRTERDALLAYLEALFGRDRDALIEIAHRPRREGKPMGMRRGDKGGLFLPAANPEAAADEIERLAQHADVWVGVLPRRPDPASGEIGGSQDFIPDGRVLWIDSDLRETPNGAELLSQFVPKPQIVVRSGGGFHAYWLLDKPLARDWIPIANRRLAHALGADLGATDAARILRPPSTVNRKYDPPRPVALVERAAQQPYAVREIVGGLPNPPGRRSTPRRRDRQADLSGDPLRAIPPPVYVRTLAGADVPDAGAIVSCPLPDHEDPEPSCQVFADPARGWYCYGCQRGGSIYDFAAHLLGRTTSGREFIALRRELERRFDMNPSRTGAATRKVELPGPDSPPRTTSAADGGERATAVLDRPPPGHAGPALEADLEPPTVPVAEPGLTDTTPGSLGAATAGGEPLGLLTLPAIKATALLLGVLLAGMGLFVVIFALVPLSQPETGELACGISGEARRAVPARYLVLYRRAGRRFGLDWAVLAAIGEVESGHGHNMGPSSAGARGPMQFMPSTWGVYGVDGDRDGRRDIMDPADAIPGAAKYLRASGAPRDWRQAIFAYNHADWYVELVLRGAERYRAACRQIVTFEGGSGALGWPVHGPVTSPFGMRWGRLHAGLDIGAATGTPVHAAERGRIALLGPFQGYGNYICIRQLPRLTSCYAHLSAFRSRQGKIVRRGEVIGLVGCTGHCFGPHLHFEVRLGPPWSRPVDPQRYLTGQR